MCVLKACTKTGSVVDKQRSTQITLELFQRGVLVSKNIICRLLQGSTIKKDLDTGRKVHCLMINYGIDSNSYYGNQLIGLYTSCGSLLEASQAFCKVYRPSVHTWGSVISAHVKLGKVEQALELYYEMQCDGVNPNESVFLCVLKAWSKIGTVGAIEAMELIDYQGIPVSKNIVHCLLQGCSETKDLAVSRRIFSLMIANELHSNALLGDQLIRLFASCGGILEATQVFANICDRSVHTWNSIISAHVNLGESEKALDLYYQMLHEGTCRNRFIFMYILKACSSTGDSMQGKLIHDDIVRSGLEFDVVVGNALIDMYAKYSDIEDANKVFEELPNRDVVSWGAMIVGFSQHGHDLATLDLFERMRDEAVCPNRVIILCVLKACGSTRALGQGRLIHDQTIKIGLHSDVQVGSTLIDMYAKCGCLDDVHKEFHKLPNQNVVSWGAIIGGYAQLGNYRLAAQYLECMKLEAVKPDDVIFLSILTACSHTGLYEEGCWHFREMIIDHGIVPSTKHYNCLVDLVGRLGWLNEAEALLQSMPVSSDCIGWKSLLTSCRTHGNMELGQRCFDEIIQLDPHDASSYVLMSNICADVYMWGCVDRIQEMKKDTDAIKKPGMAWIEINKRVNTFVVGDTSHARSGKIYAKWKRLHRLEKKEGYVPQLDLVFEPL